MSRGQTVSQVSRPVAAAPPPSPPPASAPSPSRSPTSPGAEGFIEGVFLSPRVVDRGAFEEYAATLREIFEKTAGQAQTLKAASMEADGLARVLSEAAQKFQIRLDAAARVLSGLDQHVAAAGALAEQNAARGAVDQSVLDRLARLESQLAETDRPKAGRAAKAEAEALAALCARAEVARAAAEVAAREFERIHREAQEAKAELGRSLEQSTALAADMSEKQTALRASLEESVGLCEWAETALRARSAALRASIKSPAPAPTPGS